MSNFFASFLGVFCGYFCGTGTLLLYSELRERSRKKERDAYASKILDAIREPMSADDEVRVARITGKVN